MSSDDQHFLDFLSSITADVTEAVERHFDHAAVVFRQTVQSNTWIPDAIKPARAKPPPSRIPLQIGPHGLFGGLRIWLYEHQAFVAATVAFFGTGGVLLYRQRRAYMRKRRAKKAINGARSEAVIVSGMLNSPVARSVILDLERRGFIVYVITATAVEEQMVQAEGKADILPLHLNVTDVSYFQVELLQPTTNSQQPFDVQQSIEHFEHLIRSPQRLPHELSLKGLVLIPDSMYPAGPVQTIAPEEWADTINAKVLGTIATTQALLRTICEFRSRIVMLTPSIIHSLKPPFHAPESAVVGALDGFAHSLRGELATLGLQVCEIKMGAFDASLSQSLSNLSGGRHETLSWPGFARTAYAENFLTQQHQFEDLVERRRRGSPLRELNNEVFDALSLSNPKSVSLVGRGALTYKLLGDLAPASLVRWMLGLRQTTSWPAETFRRSTDSVQWERVEKTSSSSSAS